MALFVRPSNVRKVRRNLPFIILLCLIAMLIFITGMWAGQTCLGLNCLLNSGNKDINLIRNNHTSILVDIKQTSDKHEGTKKNGIESKGNEVSVREELMKKNMRLQIQKGRIGPSYKEKEIMLYHAPVKTGTASQKDLDVKYEPPAYVQIREADSPTVGDFTCGGTAVPNCCAFYIGSVAEGKKICNSYKDYCKGFVLSSLSAKAEKLEYLMYLKTSVSSMTINYLTDFFIKTDFVKRVGWRTGYEENETF